MAKRSASALSVKVSSESSTKSPDLSKSNTSEMKRQIAATTVGVKSKHAVITTMKNKSSQLNKAVKFTNDSNKIIEEKQMQIQNILTFPGHSFILVLSEKIEEDTKAYNCVLCYQNSFRTDLQGMIQHCKSKEHLLKVMELVNLKDADLGSQKGTSDEIAAVLKGRTSNLDKDGVSFATLSTFLSIQKKIYKRIVALRKEKTNTPASTPRKIKLSADIGANKKAGMKDPKVTTCGVNSLEKGKPQIVKFAQYPGDPSQGQKQTLKRLHPGSKTLSKTAVNITVAEFESDKFSETKEGKRKIEKIVWDKDKINTSKSDSDKSSETKNGKRKIEKIVWDKNKITASKSESDTSSEMGKRKRKIVEVDWDEDKITAATSEAEKSFETKKNKKIVLNEENFMEEDSDDGIFDLKNLNKFEREVYETYKKELNELVELSRNRRPYNVTIVTDKRDVFTGDEINTKYNLYKIIKDENLTFSNIKQYLVRDPEFGSGVLYVILCGINSVNSEKINPSCLKAQCTSPCKFLDNTNCEINLIRKALYIHKVILKFNKKDTAIFSGLIPSLPNIFNDLSYKKRKCSRNHAADLSPQCIEEYDINKLHLYNTFTKLHSKLLGFTPLNLERGFIIKNKNSDNPIVTFNFKTILRNGYHFTDTFASNRKLAMLNKCDKLMEKLSQSTHMEQDEERLNRFDGGPKSNIRIDYTSQSEEAAVTQVTLNSKNESFLHEKIMNYNSIPMTKELQSNYQPVQRVPLEAISASSSKFDKIVVLGNSSYKYYLEELRGSKVCIMSDDISTDDLLDYIKCKEPLMPSRTLWVLVTGIEFLFRNSVNKLCSGLRCSHPLQSTLPSDKVALYSKALITIHEMNIALNIIEQNVKRVLNFESDFMFFPPIPPAMIIDSSIAHQDIHNFLVKYPRCYIVTNIIASYFIDIFKKVSFSFAHFTLSALGNMGISADPIKKYFDYQLNQIDFISGNITLPPNKLPFFSAWSNIFREIVSSCVGDSCCFEVSSERESYFKSSRIVIYSDDENDETDFESRAVLSEYEKKSLSKVKSDCRIVFEGSSKNECQYEVIDLTKESDVKSVESVVECKSSIVKAADGVSSQIKENTVVSKNAFDTSSKPSSKETFEKSGRDPKSTSSAKQSSCEPTKTEQECNIYETAAEPGNSTIPHCLETAKKTNITKKIVVKSAQSVAESKSSFVTAADSRSSQNKEKTEKSFVSLTKPLSKDTFEKSVKDPKPKLSAKNVKQPMCKSAIVKQKCSIYEIAADDRPLPFLDSLESDAKPETLTALYEPDPKSEQEMESEIFDNFEEFSEENLCSEIFNDSADNISNIDSSKDAKELPSKSVKEHLNKKPSNDSAFHITTQIVSRNLKEEETENINTVGDSKTKEKVGKSSSNEQINLVETLKESKMDSTESTFITEKENFNRNCKTIDNQQNQLTSQPVTKESDLFMLKATKQSSQIYSSHSAIDSAELMLTKRQPISHRVSEDCKVSSLELPKHSLQNDANSSSLIPEETNKTELHTINQTLSNKTGVSNLDVTKINSNNSSIVSKEVNTQYLQVYMPCEGKESKELSHGCSNDKQTISNKEPVFDKTKIHPQTSPVKTDDVSVGKESKLNNCGAISREISTGDCNKSNKKFIETPSNQSLTNRKEECEKYDRVIFIANNHINNYLKYKLEVYSYWDIEFPINWTHFHKNISSLSPTQSYFFVIVVDFTLLTYDSPMNECLKRECKQPIIVHHLDFQYNLLLTKNLNSIRSLHKNLTNFPNINTKVVLTNHFPRKCLDIRSINFSDHSMLHSIKNNKFRPCFLDGDFDDIDHRAVEFKMRWLEFVKSLYFSKDLKKRMLDELFTNTHNSFNPIFWITISDLDLPFIPRRLWIKKLIIMIDFYKQMYLTVPKPSNIIKKSDTKSLNFNANNEGNTISPNSTSNQNNEEVDAEKILLDSEELLISEELEREILEADDGEFEEDPAAKTDSVVENKTLNDENGGGIGIGVAPNKSSNLKTISEDLNDEQKAIAYESQVAEVIENTNLMNTNVNLIKNISQSKFDMAVIIEAKVSEKNENPLLVVDHNEDLNGERKAGTHANETVEMIDKTNLLNTNMNLNQNVKMDIIEKKELNKKENYLSVVVENTENELSKLELTDSVAENVVKQDNNALKDNYFTSELITSEYQDGSKSCVPNVDVHAISFSSKCENEKILVDMREQITKQEKNSDDRKMENDDDKTPSKIDFTRKEDRNEVIEEEKFEFTSTKKVYDNNEPFIQNKDEFLMSSTEDLLQSRKSFQKTILQVGSNSCKVTNIKNNDSDDVDIKDSGSSSCINIETQNQTENSIGTTDLSLLQSPKNIEINVSKDNNSKINSDEKFTCKEALVSSSDNATLNEGYEELETRRETNKNPDASFPSQKEMDQKRVAVTEEYANDSSLINKEGKKNEENVMVDNFHGNISLKNNLLSFLDKKSSEVDDTSSQDVFTKGGNYDEICADNKTSECVTSEKRFSKDVEDHSDNSESDKLNRFFLDEQVSNNLNLNKNIFGENCDIKVNKVNIDDGVCSDPSLNVNEKLSDKLSGDINMLTCSPEEHFICSREDKTPDRKLDTTIELNVPDTSHKSDINFITISDDNKILGNHPNINFVGTENGEIFICHHRISENCSREFELFSGKVLTNIPDNKEPYNDEVKRQNLFEDRCQMNEEKVNKTKETAKNLIIKDTNNKMQNVDTEDYTTTQPLKINGKETDAKNKLENPDITEPQSTLIKTVEDCAISEHLGPNYEENAKNKQNMDTTVHLPVLIKTIENVTTQPLRLNDKESLEIDYDDTLTDANSKDMKWKSTVNENLEEKGKNENMNVTSSFVEVIQSDINHLNKSVVLGKNLKFSSNILPLEEESSEEDMYKSSKIEENSDSSCDDNKSDLGEDIQEQLLIEEELEAEIFGDDECSYDDDDGNDDEGKARDVLEDDIENSSPAAVEPDRENIPTSKHAYSSLSKEDKLHSNNSDIQIESFLNNVKEVALEINNVRKDKEDLESCESTSVLENDTKISVSETKSENITKETLNITVDHISERNFSSGSIPEDKDFASNDSSQALTRVTIDNDLKMDESFRKSEDSEEKHEVEMDSFDYDLLNKESDIIFDLEKASDSQSSNERFGKSEKKNVSNNEQNIENKKGLQDSMSNKIESSAVVDIKSQNQNVSEIAFENLDASNQVQKFNICTDIFDETVVKRGKLENFYSKIEVVQDLCDERKANQIEDVGVGEKTFEKEETSEDKPDISEGSKKITEESDEQSKLKFVSGEETTEKSNITIKLKLGESVDNSDQTVDFEMSEASRDSTKKEMSKLTIDHIEILNDPNVIKLVADDQKNNEVNFLRLVDRDEKLIDKESFKVDNDKFVDHVNHNDSVVKDRVNEVIEEDLNAENEVEMHEDSLKKIAFENIVDDVVDNLEENVETNLNKIDIIKDTPSNTTFDKEKLILKDKLENKADHPIDEHFDSPVKDDLTGGPINIVKDFKNTDSPANFSENEPEQYSNKTNVQNLSLKEISKNETLNVQEDLQENTDGHLTVFDVLESIVRKEVILQQHIDNCNLKKPQTQSISNETSEVNVQCDVPKDEASILSNYNNVNSNQKINDVSINIEELCDFKIEKSSLKPSKIIETGSFPENASLNEILNHKKHETLVGEDSSKSIISNNNNTKIIDFINLDDNLNSSVIQSNPVKKDSSGSKDPKHIHDSIPQQNLLDQEIDSSVRCESAKEDLLEMPCDNVYGNFEEKCEHPVSKVEDKNKIENKCDKTLSNVGTTVHDVPMKKKKLVEYDDDDVFEIRVKGKEETANHTVSEISSVYDIENSDTNESIVIKACNDPLNNYSDYSNMNYEVKSGNMVVNNSSEELNKSACDLKKNATTEFINPSTTSINSLELNETTKITKDLENPSSSYESAPNKDPLKKMTAKAIEDHFSKSEIQPEGEKKEASYKFKLLKKESENKINKSVPYLFLSDSEVEEKDSSNTNSEKGTKIENVIPRYDHIYIIGGFNPLSKKNQKLLNFTFINKSISDLNEDNVIDLLDEKGCIVANSLCIFICDIIDIMKKRVETKSITSKSNGNDFIVYELKDSSSNATEEGKLFISKSITSFIRIVDRLRNKLSVVVMPLQPYMLTVQFNFAMNESGPDDSRLFIHGSSYKWTHYRDHFVNDWMRILDKNNKNINKTYIEPFVTKPPFVYPIRNAELKGIGIKRRKLEWTIKVNEVILKLVKAEFKTKSKKSADSIKKEKYTTAGCNNEKFCEGEKCEIKITNLSESIPNKFFEEMSKKVGKGAICKFEEGYVEITFDCHLKGQLFGNYLNNLAIGDTILKTTFLDKDCEKGIPKLNWIRRRNFRECLRSLFELWEVSASEIVKKNIRHTLSCESYKTIECEKSECDEASCIFYHSEMDRRRNPYSVPYGSGTCKFICSGETCIFGDECRFAHNDYEFMFHPSEIYFKLCEDNKTRKQCFSVHPLCARAHRDSPETFFTEYWNDSLLFGTPLAVEFLVGAISKFNLFNSAYKDTRIFMMGASMPFLHNVRKAVNQICGIHALKHDFVGERELVFECEPLLFGTPSNFLKRIGHLVVLPFTLIIVSQIDVLLSIRKERKALINFFARCQMTFSPPYVHTLFVADEYDADMQAKIKHYFSKNVKVITNPEHKVKYDHDVPCTPFALNALPKWLNTGSNPSQVYPFLSAEVAKSVVEGNKKKLENTPWLRKETFYSSDSSECSDSSELTSSDTEDDRRSNRRDRKRKTSRSSENRSTSPSHKRYCSRSPTRRRSTSRCSLTKPVKRPHSRQSCSSISSCELVPYNRSSSSSLSPERFPKKKKKKGRADEEGNNEICNYSPARRNPTVRDAQYLSNRSHSKRSSEVHDIKDRELKESRRRKSAVEELQERSSRSPPKKRTNVRDEKVQSIKPSQSPPLPLPPSPPPPRIPPGSTFPGKDKKEQTQPDISMDRIVHRSKLLESAIQIFNTTSLREELGNILYEEFEAAREKLCFKLEEEFDVYKTMPNLCDKFEECYEGFMQVYKIKYPNQSEEHKEELWKLFWLAKFDFIEKKELRNRMVNLIVRFRQKVQSVPPPPPPPIISGMDSRFKPCKSEIKMSSASDVSTAAYTLPSSNASSTNRISDAYSNSTPVLSSNAPMSTSQVSDYSNFSHVPPPPPKISSFKQRFSGQHLDNPVEGQMKIRHSPFPPPPPILSDHSSQGTYNNAYYSNETSGVQARFHPSSSLSNFTCWDLYSMYSGQSLDNKFSSSNTLSLHESVDGKPPLTTYEEIDKRTCKSSYPSSKGSSVYSSQRETPPVEKAHSPLPSIPVESLPARIMALAKALDIKNKPLNEVANISPLPSSSFNTSSVTSGHMPSTDNQSKRNSPMISSVITSTHTKDIKEFTVSEDESSLKDFSMEKAIADLELIVPDIGALSSSIKYIINIAKENGINSEKALKTFVDDDNITLMELALMKIKGMEGKKKLYSSLERSVNGLIKYAKGKLLKKERKELALNFEGIAKATVGKDSSAILQMIRTAARYEGVELTKQQENESYMKVCSIHFNMATNKEEFLFL